MKKISVVVPVYNEEEGVVAAYNALGEAMGLLKNSYTYEIIFIDNHSNDKTFSVLQELAKKDTRLKIVRFSRNFGYQRSIYTGYILSSGDAVIQFDCDLQDPPQMIPEFIHKWEAGYAVVYGIRIKRPEAWFMNFLRKVFYRMISFLSEEKLPYDAGDFRLVDKKIVQELRQLYDYYPYLRGMIASLGFEQIGIPYERQRRLCGRSKFSFRDLFNLAIDGIVSHSILPLRLASYFGLIVFVFAFLLILVYLAGRVFFGQAWPKGFATITALVLFSLGLNAFFLGVIGEYIGRIYQQVKRRPISVIDKMVNFNNSNV